jgi:hypothetical protein
MHASANYSDVETVLPLMLAAKEITPDRLYYSG